MADQFGTLTDSKFDLLDFNWELFTLKEPAVLGNPDKYIMFLKYNKTHPNFLVQKCENEANKSSVGVGDLVYYTCNEIPIVITFAMSSVYNPIFDLRVKGINRIEDALNEHLRDHELVVLQEMDMTKFKHSELALKEMSHIFHSNQQIMNHVVEYESEHAQSIKEMFTLGNEQRIAKKQVEKIMNNFYTRVQELFDGFITSLKPKETKKNERSNDQDIIQLKKLDGFFKEKLTYLKENEIFTEEIKTRLLRRLNLFKTKVNYFIEKIVIESEINLFVNPFIFKSAHQYFPNKVEIGSKEFIDMYSNKLLKNIVREVQMDDLDGELFDMIEGIFKESSTKFRKIVSNFLTIHRNDFIEQFERSIKDLLEEFKSPKFMIIHGMQLRAKSAIYYYLEQMKRIENIRSSGVILENGDIVIMKLIEVMEYFGLDRDSENAGYSVEIKVFEIYNDQDHEDNFNDDERLVI
jgi:hypothetical protein